MTDYEKRLGAMTRVQLRAEARLYGVPYPKGAKAEEIRHALLAYFKTAKRDDSYRELKVERPRRPARLAPLGRVLSTTGVRGSRRRGRNASNLWFAKALRELWV